MGHEVHDMAFLARKSSFTEEGLRVFLGKICREGTSQDSTQYNTIELYMLYLPLYFISLSVNHSPKSHDFIHNRIIVVAPTFSPPCIVTSFSFF